MARAKTKKRTRPVSLNLRLVLGKFFGFLLGGLTFLSLGELSIDITPAVKLGMWGWYIVFGAFIALAGVYTRHPLLGFKMPSMLRGACLGFGLNLVVGALIFQDTTQAFASYSDFVMSNQFPILEMAIEGLIWGALIDLALTFYAGEGKDLVKKL